MKKLLLFLLGLCAGAVHAETLKFTVAQTANANGTVTPVLTWCTEQTQSTGTTCSGTPASACTASGAWTGTKAASGSETLAAVATTTSYTLQCSWPGADQFTVGWVPPTTNDDGSLLTDLKGYKVYYSTSSSMSNNQVKDVQSAAANSVVVGPGLAPATYYIVVSAYNVSGAESKKAPPVPLQKVLSGGASVTGSVKVTIPNAPTNLVVQ